MKNIDKQSIEREMKKLLSFVMASFLIIFGIFSLSIILPPIGNTPASIITSLLIIYMIIIYFYFIIKKMKKY